MQDKLSARESRELSLKSISPGAEAPFSKGEYRDRLNRVRAEMARKKIDVLYLSSPESLFYISGYAAEWYMAQSPNAPSWWPVSGIAIEADHDDFILFDSEFEEGLVRLTTVSTDPCIMPERDFTPNAIAKELKKKGWIPSTVGLEMWSYRPNRVVSEMFQKELEKEGCRVVDGSDIVRDLRWIKSPQEIAYIEKAGRIVDLGMKAAIETMRPGMTELEVYGEIVHAMAKAGGENPALPVLVLSGEKTGSGHALASRRRIKHGDIVDIDLCGVFNRYHADIDRTFSIGKPHPDVARFVELSAKSFEVVSELIRPNLPVAELNERLYKYYKEAGMEEWLLWSGGYELGIGFPPDWVGWFTYSAVPPVDPGDRVFVPGTVVNLESLFLLPHGAGGGGIINTLVFEKERARILSQIPNDLIII